MFPQAGFPARIQTSSQVREYMAVHPSDGYRCTRVTGTHPRCGPQIFDDTFYPVHHVPPHGLLLRSGRDEVEKIHDFFMEAETSGKKMGHDKHRELMHRWEKYEKHYDICLSEMSKVLET